MSGASLLRVTLAQDMLIVRLLGNGLEDVDFWKGRPRDTDRPVERCMAHRYRRRGPAGADRGTAAPPAAGSGRRHPGHRHVCLWDRTHPGPTLVPKDKVDAPVKAISSAAG
jgi:hypothetical protein